MAHEIIWEPQGIRRNFSGTISVQEIVSSNLLLHGDERFDNARYVLNDFTTVSAFSVSEEGITKISVIDNIAAISKPRLRIAIVTTNQDLAPWIQMYLQLMHDAQYECELFTSTAAAHEWLSMD